MRLQDALQRFTLQLEADGRSPHTIAQYQRHVGQCARWLARVGRSDELDQIDHEVVALFLAGPDARTSQRGGSKRPGSINALRSSLKGFLAFTHQAGYAPTNAGRLIRRARTAPPPFRVLSPVDQQRLMETLAQAKGREAARDRVLVGLLLHAGLRLSSALALEDWDIDPDRAVILARHCKGALTQRILLGPRIVELLAAYLRGRPAGPLFPGHGQRYLSRRHAARRIAKWMKLAGCGARYSPHALRRSFGMAAYERCGDVLAVKALLHHRSILSTMAYVDAGEQRLRAILSRLGPGGSPGLGPRLE